MNVPPKILILIISCDTEPFYKTHRIQWRRYMNTYPGIQSFFIRHGNANENRDEDTLWLPGRECGFQIYDKTAKALQVLLRKPEFHSVEYIVRTNMSSFYILPRLYAHIYKNGNGTQPKQRWVHGRIVQQSDGVPYPSGCGMIFSRDIGELWASAPCPEKQYLADDWAFGYLLRRHGIPIEPADCFMLPNEETMIHFRDRILPMIPNTTFHIRLRMGTPAQRLRYESENYAFLVDCFFPETIGANTAGRNAEWRVKDLGAMD